MEEVFATVLAKFSLRVGAPGAQNKAIMNQPPAQQTSANVQLTPYCIWKFPLGLGRSPHCCYNHFATPAPHMGNSLGTIPSPLPLQSFLGSQVFQKLHTVPT